jgi:hypothetical protein
MLQAVIDGRKSWRVVPVLGGVLVAGGLLALAAMPGPARGGPKDPPARDSGGKGAAKPAPMPEFHHSVDPKTPAAAEVADAVKLINDKLEAGWAQNKITPSRFVDDYEFIRRASLDIIGRVAKPEEVREYLRDPAELRRSRLINRLLASDEYPAHWANLWSNWLLGRSGPFGRNLYKEQMTSWLKERFALNKPYHEIVRELLTASGKNTENGAVNFILAHVGENIPPQRRAEEGQFEMVPVTARVTRLFLGVQVQCAQCHDHPFQANIKQEHFWGINAYLRQVTRVGNLAMNANVTPGPLELRDNPNACREANVFFEKRNGVILTQRAEFLPSGEEKHGKRLDAAKVGVERREVLAGALIDHENFPRAVVNRVWGVFFGRGFVNPVDDFNDNNQPSNPELLGELGSRLKNYNYDLKKLIRWVCHSKAYNLSCVANKTNDKPEHEPLFSRLVIKSMTPEQLFESLMVATRAEAAESKDKKRELRDRWLRNLISNFGDDEGNEVNFNGTVVQALLMMNGQEINEAINRKDKGTLAVAFKRGRGTLGIINELYLAALNRPPTPYEVQRIQSSFQMRSPVAVHKDYQDPVARFEDLFWALLNSNEFILNH